MPGGEGQHGPGDVTHLVADVGSRPYEAITQPPGDDRVRPDFKLVTLVIFQRPNLDPAASHSTEYSLPTESGSPMLVMLTSTGG